MCEPHGVLLMSNIFLKVTVQLKEELIKNFMCFARFLISFGARACRDVWEWYFERVVEFVSVDNIVYLVFKRSQSKEILIISCLRETMANRQQPHILSDEEILRIINYPFLDFYIVCY